MQPYANEMNNIDELNLSIVEETTASMIEAVRNNVIQEAEEIFKETKALSHEIYTLLEKTRAAVKKKSENNIELFRLDLSQ